jgi:signal recognition particle GTPase
MSDEDTTQETEAPEAEEQATETETDAPEAEDKDEQWDPERAKRKIAKLNSEAANLRKRLNEAPKAEDAAAKDKRITDLESAALRYEVALDLGLPKEIASRLQGKDRDEMVADAEKLLELLAPAKRPATRKPTEALRGGLDSDTEPEETDLKKLGERMFSR